MSVGVPFAVIASLKCGQDKQELQAYRKLLVTVGRALQKFYEVFFLPSTHSTEMGVRVEFSTR